MLPQERPERARFPRALHTCLLTGPVGGPLVVLPLHGSVATLDLQRQKHAVLATVSAHRGQNCDLS